MPAVEDKPKISISNNQLGLFLMCWAVFTQARDMIANWAVRTANQEAQSARVVEMDKRLSALDEAIKLESKKHQDMLADTERLRGDVRAEVSRSFGADEGLRETLDFIKQTLAAPRVSEAKPAAPAP